MKKILLKAAGRFSIKNTGILVLTVLLSLTPFGFLQAQCTTGNGFTKVTNGSGTVNYPGASGNPAVKVTATTTGDAGAISFCNITSGFRAGTGDRSGAFKFSFSPAVNSIFINLNALSNTPDDREVVRIKVNDAPYTVTAANIVCSANCFGCSGTSISAAGGAVTASLSNTGNGTGQLLIQSIGPINSIEYVNEVQVDEPQGSVFELFFSNGNCVLPVTLASFTASASAGGTQLRWTASAQANVRSYQPERSADGLNFTPLTRVPANTGGSYQYTDAAAPAGTSYYRLKMTDRDNSYAYSATVAVTAIYRGNKVLFDAANNLLTIRGLNGTNVITVYTLAGSKLTGVTTGLQAETISTVQWPAGLYIVQMTNKSGLVGTEKILKP